jgi:hypothetical protein
MNSPSDESTAIADFRRRSRALVGDDESLPEHKRRIRALKQIDAADYVPAPAWSDAVEALAAKGVATPAGCGAALHCEIESQLADEVAEFARQFFSLPPPERQARWRDLLDRAQFWPAVRLWLSQHRAGLALCVPAVDGDQDEDTAELVRRIAALYAQRPDIRVRLAGQLVEAFAERPQAAKAAAARLRVAHPEFAAIVPRLLDEMVRLPSRQKQMARFRAASRRRQKLWHRAWRSVWSNIRRPVRGFRIPAIIVVLWIVKTLVQVNSPSRRFEPSRPPSGSMQLDELRAQLEKDPASVRVGPGTRRLLGLPPLPEWAEDHEFRPDPPPLPEPVDDAVDPP